MPKHENNSLIKMLESKDGLVKPNNNPTKYSNPVLLNHIEKYFEINGFYNSTTQQIKNHLLTVMPKQEVPSVTTIQKILKIQFHLKYSALDKGNLKYRDSTFDEKRLWVSRLLG
jgi:hypothetical protein